MAVKKKRKSSGGIPMMVYELAVVDVQEEGLGLVTPDKTFTGGVVTPDKTFSGGVVGWVARRTEVDPDALQRNLRRFTDTMGDAINRIPPAIGGFTVDELEIEVEVNAEAEVGLLGTGGKMGGKGSLTLHLKRRDA